MCSTTHRSESTAAALYVALELRTKEWLLTMSAVPNGRRERARLRPGNREAFARGLARANARVGLAPDAPVRSCYEAGREGFWPHRFLTALGVTNLVVASSSIEVPRRARRATTDRWDGETLLRLLLRHWGGEQKMWQVVHVPSREAEDARHASRGRTTLHGERTRYRNRLHRLLSLHRVSTLRIDPRFPERVATAVDWAGALLPPGIQGRLLALWRGLQPREAERQRAQREERQQIRATPATVSTRAQRFVRLRGIAARSAPVLADELLSRDLRNRREVGALAGLVSAPYRRGTMQRDQGLVRSGVPAVRRIAVEIAWAWLRDQPTSALTHWYPRQFGGGGAVPRRSGIVALARRVILALWRYSEHGIVPEGALLKA
jgi:transposase